MLTYVKQKKPQFAVDLENLTIDGYKLEYYRTKDAQKRIRIKELNIDLSDYIY